MKSPITPPQLTISIGGTPLATSIHALLIEVRVAQRLSMPTQCELVFLDPDGAIAERCLAWPGAELELRLEEAGTLLFRGDVTACDCAYLARGSEVRLRGYDALNRLARRQSVRAFVQSSLSEIARHLTADLHATVACEGSDKVFDRVLQHEQTDLQLLVQLAERRAVHFFYADGTLIFKRLRGNGPARSLRLGEELLEATISRNDMHCRDSVAAVGWDSWLAKPYSAKVDASGDGLGKLSKLTSFLVNRPIRDEAEALLRAQAEVAHLESNRLSLVALAEGDASLTPGTCVRVEGVATGAAGPYWLTAVTHVIDSKSGFVSEIRSAPERSSARRSGVSATLGRVTRTDDPEGLGRIQVALPAFGDIATDWTQMSSPWAGAKKGLMAQPDIDDCVLYLFFDADLAHGIVIGSLYGSSRPPEDWAKSAAGQRYTFATPGRQRVMLDDALKLARVENGDGSFLELAPGHALIHSNAELRIEAPGQPVVIVGKTIDFRQE